MFGVDAIVSEHLKVFLEYMYNQSFDEIKSGNTFFNGFIVLVSCVMKSNIIAVIFINTRGGDNGTTKVSADVFDGDIRSTKVRFGTDIEAFGMIFKNIIFDFAKRRPDCGRHLFQKNFTESITKESIVEMLYGTPRSNITGSAFGDEGMNVRILFEVATKGVKNTDETSLQDI